jgi:hypothetical protein
MAAGDGLTGLVTPRNTSEFEAMTAAAQAHFNGVRGQLEVIAYDLRRLLPHAKNVGGSRALFGLDLKMAARQVSRQLIQAAAAQNASSAAMAKALTVFHGNFTGNPRSGGSGFDAGR